MCFLSVYRLKWLISLGIVITLTIGIALLYVLVYSFVISSITAQVQTTFRALLIALFLSTALLMILSSLSGIYGLIRRKNKFVVVYALTLVVYMLSFLALAILTMNSPQFVESQCQSSDPSEYQLTTNHAKDMLCKAECECYFTNSHIYSNAQLAKMNLFNSTTESSDQAVNAQSCSAWDSSSYPLSVQISILESFFQCAGWCGTQANLYYLFSNLNYGFPKTTCVQALSVFLQNSGQIIEIASFCVSGVTLSILVVILCLWLHPDRRLRYDSMELFKNTLVFINQQLPEEQSK